MNAQLAAVRHVRGILRNALVWRAWQRSQIASPERGSQTSDSGGRPRSCSTRRSRSRLITWWPCTRCRPPHTAHGRGGRPTTCRCHSHAAKGSDTRSEDRLRGLRCFTGEGSVGTQGATLRRLPDAAGIGFGHRPNRHVRGILETKGVIQLTPLADGRRKDKRDRFWPKVLVGGPSECWPWQNATSDGYGMVAYKGRTQRAHVVAYLLAIGPIPARAHVHHTCENRACCNPAHLKLLAPGEHAVLHNPPRRICEHGNHKARCRVCERNRKRRERAAEHPMPEQQTKRRQQANERARRYRKRRRLTVRSA